MFLKETPKMKAEKMVKFIAVSVLCVLALRTHEVAANHGGAEQGFIRLHSEAFAQNPELQGGANELTCYGGYDDTGKQTYDVMIGTAKQADCEAFLSNVTLYMPKVLAAMNANTEVDPKQTLTCKAVPLGSIQRWVHWQYSTGLGYYGYDYGNGSGEACKALMVAFGEYGVAHVHANNAHYVAFPNASAPYPEHGLQCYKKGHFLTESQGKCHKGACSLLSALERARGDDSPRDCDATPPPTPAPTPAPVITCSDTCATNAANCKVINGAVEPGCFNGKVPLNSKKDWEYKCAYTTLFCS